MPNDKGKPSLRVVKGDGDGAPQNLADASRAILEKAIADGAVVVMILYETPSRIGVDSYPRSEIVLQGMAQMLADILDNPQD